MLRRRFDENLDPSRKAVNVVIHCAMSILEKAGRTFVDVSIDNLDHYLNYTRTYLIRSRSDINTFLVTKPHLPQDIADIVPKQPAKPYLDLVYGMAHGLLDPNPDATYVVRLLQRDEPKRKVDCLIASNSPDPLMLSDVQIPPPLCDDAYNVRFQTDDFPANTFLASQASLPAISVPAGFTQTSLPVSMQLIGLEYQEQQLLELARRVEVMVESRTSPETVWGDSITPRVSGPLGMRTSQRQAHHIQAR